MADKELLTEALKEIREICEDGNVETAEQIEAIEAIVDEVLGVDSDD